jgi:hypothetical protein
MMMCGDLDEIKCLAMLFAILLILSLYHVDNNVV